MSIREWLTLAVVCVILEIVPPATHFHFLCLTFGALGAAVAATVAPPWVCWLVFGLASIALVKLLVPLAHFLFARRQSAAELAEKSSPPDNAAP